MQEIFIALILIFDVSAGLPIEAAAAGFTDKEVCEQVVAATLDRARSDLQIHVEGMCLTGPLIGSE